MNFFTLIFKRIYSPQMWIKLILLSSIFISISIFILNYIVDPYNLTDYNLLKIKHKLARDDRRNKLNNFKGAEKFDNIIIGSSRVYTYNPKIVSDILGGRTYNFGVGTASPEDHLGIVLYLERVKKLPKNIIIGIDFYTFNPDLPPDRHFLRTKELNFLSFGKYIQKDFEIFFSIDALRASFKTLKHHIAKTGKKGFDENGWTGGYVNYDNLNAKQELINAQNEILDIKSKFYSDYKYGHLDEKRMGYYNKIIEISKKNNINLYFFTTPIHPILLTKLKSHDTTNKALNELVDFCLKFDNFDNFYEHEEFKTNLNHFTGATHTKPNAGDVILKTILQGK